jgi:leucyl-tRNA synthetase
LPNDEILANEWKEKLLIILHPFAPHITEELWEKNPHISNKGDNSIFFASWPKYDEKLVVDDTIII